MTTFARIVDGYAIDCRVHTSATELAACFHPSWLAVNPFVVVPDGTAHGAKDNGDGTFTNPAIQNPPASPATLSASAFQDLCVNNLGGNSIGETRFGAIVRTMSTSADDLVFSVYQRFIKSSTFDKSKSIQMFQILQNKGIMTSQERNAIINAWPNL